MSGEDSNLQGPSAAEPHVTASRPRWWIYHGTGRSVIDLAAALPKPPPWRTFTGGPVQPAPPSDESEGARRLGAEQVTRGIADSHVIDMVNAALYLRRPLLVTGRPGTGKSSIAYQVSRELRLGRVLRWPITSRSTFKSGLYEYDAIGRAQAVSAKLDTEAADIGNYLRLGPVGTALLPWKLPRVLLIDELDKSDIDLPSDLLNAFEEGSSSYRSSCG
ncbi:AAA family ATPase [Dactylosporangium cerinum]